MRSAGNKFSKGPRPGGAGWSGAARLRPLLALGLLAALGLAAEPALSQEQPIRISAAELAWAFAVDEEAAAEKYRDKKIILTGWATSIRLIDGRPVLEFAGIKRYREEDSKYTNIKTHIDRKTRKILERAPFESVLYYLDPDRPDITEGAVASMVDFRNAYRMTDEEEFIEIDGHQVRALTRDRPGYTVECELKIGPAGGLDRDQRPGLCRLH